MIIPFGTRPGPWGCPFPARGRGTELLASRSGLQGQRSPVCSRDRAGRELGSAGLGGATIPSSAPGPMAGDPASERPVTLSPPLRLHFLRQKERGGEERKGLLPRASALVSGVIDRRSALSLACFLLPLTLHQVWTPIAFLPIYMRSGPQGQLSNGMAGTLMAWKEQWGMGDSCFFLPPPKLSLISFQASVFLFNTKCWNRLRSVLGKKWSFLFIGLDRILSSLSGNWCVGDSFCLPCLTWSIHPLSLLCTGTPKPGPKKSSSLSANAKC